MKKSVMLFVLLANLGLGSIPTAYAADVESLKRLFEQSFQSLYQRDRAGKNVLGFLRLAMQKEIDLRGASLIQVVNVGASNFGFVQAHKARQRGPFKGENRDRDPGVVNWEYHAFVLADGQVFDFDFENSPRILPVSEYIIEMYSAGGKGSPIDQVLKSISSYQAEIAEIRAVPPSESASAREQDFLSQPAIKKLEELL